MKPLGVVIGATGALGRAITLRLLADDLEVIAVARSASDLDDLAKAAHPVSVVSADIGSDASIDAIRDAVGGPVRIVVMAAGLPATGGLGEVPTGAIGAAVNQKVDGLLRAIRAVDSHLSSGSRIVALGGFWGTEPSPDAPAASVTNIALTNLIRQLARHLGPRGITAHLISPGPVETPRLLGIADRVASQRGVPADQVMDEFRSASPLGRLATPAQVAWSVSLLLAAEADALTGTTLALDSGQRHAIG
jgi:NAD(P)-dependent dehydrogenase (short-subunit alcohol dehydrogenase family)